MDGRRPVVSLLVIDEDADDLRLIQDSLSVAEVDIHVATDPLTGLEIFKNLRPRIVIVDPTTAVAKGIDLLDRLLTKDPGAEIILLSRQYSTECVIDAIQKGARDYLRKPLNPDELHSCISNLLGEVRKRRTTFELERHLFDSFQFEGIVGRSPLMLDVFAKIRRIAPHFQTVLVMGQTGTGKGLVARALHRLSDVGSTQLIVCNCALIDEALFESQLLSDLEGSFTETAGDEKPLLERVSPRTLFFDEIGEMPLGAQSQLLRVLKQQEPHHEEPGTTPRGNIRVIAAAHHDLRSLIRQGQFLEGLLCRLGTFEISLPRLADRKEDLPLLERFIVEKYAKQYGKKINGLTRRAQTCLAAYSWPGNIGELECILRLAVITARDQVLDLKDLPDALIAGGTSDSTPTIMTSEELRYHHAQCVLSYVGWDKNRAARMLGISSTTLHDILSQGH